MSVETILLGYNGKKQYETMWFTFLSDGGCFKLLCCCFLHIVSFLLSAFKLTFTDMQPVLWGWSQLFSGSCWIQASEPHLSLQIKCQTQNAEPEIMVLETLAAVGCSLTEEGMDDMNSNCTIWNRGQQLVVANYWF